MSERPEKRAEGRRLRACDARAVQQRASFPAPRPRRPTAASLLENDTAALFTAPSRVRSREPPRTSAGAAKEARTDGAKIPTGVSQAFAAPRGGGELPGPGTPPGRPIRRLDFVCLRGEGWGGSLTHREGRRTGWRSGSRASDSSRRSDVRGAARFAAVGWNEGGAAYGPDTNARVRSRAAMGSPPRERRSAARVGGRVRRFPPSSPTPPPKPVLLPPPVPRRTGPAASAAQERFRRAVAVDRVCGDGDRVQPARTRRHRVG